MTTTTINGRKFTVMYASETVTELRGPRGGVWMLVTNASSGRKYLISPAGREEAVV